MSDCKHETSYVIDSRNGEFGIRRRRECSECGHRWSTMEIEFDDKARGQDPWMLYRKMAVRKFLNQALGDLL